MTVQIKSIADHLELVPILAGWHYDEWGHNDPAGSPASWTEALATRTHRDRIPTTLVAVNGEEPVGSAVLVEEDMESRPDLTPWLAAVFVTPEFRGRGIGRRLVSDAMSTARDFGVPELYLYTRGTESLYEALGWVHIGREFYKSRWFSLMSVRLT